MKKSDLDPRKTIALVSIIIVIACCGVLPTAQAVSPPPDGDYGNGNTAEGGNALFSLTTAIDNTALGSNALYLNTTGSHNTAVGNAALINNTIGENNTATGDGALAGNTTGANNTATGYSALLAGGGSNNTATGVEALFSNSNTAINNTATGYQALYSNFIGTQNTAIGSQALYSNDDGGNNTATGYSAMAFNTEGFSNTANGAFALYSSQNGTGDTAVGGGALYSNTASNNTATGSNALYYNSTGTQNTATGVAALVNNTTGSYNIAIGPFAGQNLTIGDNNIDIGNQGIASEANTIRIGTSGTQTATFIAGIRGVPISGAQPVAVNANGQLGVKASSTRFKEAIKPMDKASEAILALEPVTFRYKKEIDPKGTPQFGLVAEEVAKLNPDLVMTDEQGKPFTVRYDEVNAMLLNEFLKEHHKVEEQQISIKQLKSDAAKYEAAIVDLRQGMQILTAQLKEQSGQIQKVSAQLETMRPTARIVASEP